MGGLYEISRCSLRGALTPAKSFTQMVDAPTPELNNKSPLSKLTYLWVDISTIQ